MRRHSATTRSARHGLTLLELMIALTISAVIAAAVAGMLGAVTTGIQTRRDSRESLTQAHTAQVRLSSYIASSLCVLDADLAGSNLVLWFHDARQGNTVHASEIRWLLFDSTQGTMTLYRVELPSGWSERRRRAEDREYASDANWEQVRQHYASEGLLAGYPLLDNLASVSMTTDRADPLDVRHLTYKLAFTELNTPILVSGTLRHHRQPAR